MRKLWVWLILISIVGCVSLNKNDSRKREPIVIETREPNGKPKFHMPEIRKPRVIKLWSNKEEKKMKEPVVEEKEETAQENQAEIISPPAELNKNLNEVERNKRFDNLVELEKKETQIKEDKESRLDVLMTWIGAIGVLSVFWTGVYFIARNFF